MLDVKFVRSKTLRHSYVRHSFSQGAGHLKFLLNQSLNISYIPRFLTVATQNQ